MLYLSSSYLNLALNRLEVMDLKQESLWMDPIVAYVKTSEFPRNKMEARILRMKAMCYVIYDNKLYKKGYSMSLLKCVTPSKVDYIMREIHKGIYENHTEGQSLAFKALRQR